MIYFRGENEGFKIFEKIGVSSKGVSTRHLAQNQFFDQSLKSQYSADGYPNRSFGIKILGK